MNRRNPPLGLTPVSGVAGDGSTARFIAEGSEPWLDVTGFDIARVRGRLVEVTYRASLWDAPARPLLRFWTGPGSYIDRIAAAPVAGAGVWIGRVPATATRLGVSPTNRPGAFSFAIESIRPRGWLALVAGGLRRRPRQTRSAILTRLIGWRPESDVNLAWATGSTPLAAYASWRRARERTPDPAGAERPRFDWSTATSIQLVVISGDGDLATTLASLRAQVFSGWTAHVLGGSAGADPRIRASDLETTLAALAGLATDTLVGVLAAGDVLLPLALAQVAEHANRHPSAWLFYGDEIRSDDDGRQLPFLKPGWCPRLETARPYIGRMAVVRGLASWPAEARKSFLATGHLPPSVVSTLAAADVEPLRRIIVEVAKQPSVPLPAPAIASLPSSASATIVIPTRDHPALLRRVVASIDARAASCRTDVVIVDNGSVDPAAKALLRDLGSRKDLTIIDYPGPFNFSAMCNDAAAAATGDVLVFLNDDTEIISADWLDRLVAHALDPSVGAVGAKLTYPDGRLQHVGVLVGMGESSGHFGAPAPGDDSGWAGRNQVVHEVSAVTGACLAIARKKFEAVGGFDAEHLPIELSDIDLCLKLNARGWQTIVDPQVHILHEESASRGGATFRRLDVYSAQRDVFVTRWRHVLRDDPTFHPGLSLYWYHPALG